MRFVNMNSNIQDSGADSRRKRERRRYELQGILDSVITES